MNFKIFSAFRTLAASFVIALVAMIGFGAQADDDIKAYPSTAVEGLPYSGVVRAGDLIFVGGVLGTAPGGKELVAGGITPETRAALGHVKDMLELAGSSLTDTVKCIVLLANIDDFPQMNAVFREFFPENPPTRSTIIVPEIPMGAAMEIDCNAYDSD